MSKIRVTWYVGKTFWYRDWEITHAQHIQSEDFIRRLLEDGYRETDQETGKITLHPPSRITKITKEEVEIEEVQDSGMKKLPPTLS